MYKRRIVLLSLSLACASSALFFLSACSQIDSTAIAGSEAEPLSNEIYTDKLLQAQQLQEQSQIKEAIAKYEDLVKELKPIDGRVDGRLLSVMIPLSTCYEKDGQKVKAMEAYERCVELAIEQSGDVYNNNPTLAEAPLRATILRCQLSSSPEKAAEDFESGIKAMVKYGQNIPVNLKEKFLKTYEDYLLKQNKQAEAERVSSIALAVFRHVPGRNILKSKSDMWSGLMAAVDIFVHPLRKADESGDSDAVVWLLNEALKENITDERKITIDLKLAELRVNNEAYDEAAKYLDTVKKLSKDLTQLTGQQKQVYWMAKARIAINKQRPENDADIAPIAKDAATAIAECIKIAETTPGTSLKDINVDLDDNRFPQEANMIPTLKKLCDASLKVDGAQSYSYAISCMNYATELRLSNDSESKMGESVTYDKKAVEILAKLPNPNYSSLASTGVNAGGSLLSMKRYQEAADLLEITLAMSKRKDEETLALGETPNATNSSPKAVEDLLASAYAELKQFDKLAALSSGAGDTKGGDGSAKTSAAGTGTDAGGKSKEGDNTTALLRKAYMLEMQKDPDYHGAEAAYDQASAQLLKLDDFANHPRLADGPSSKEAFGAWTSQHVPPGLIGFYERFGRFNKIAAFTEKENKGNWQTKDTGQFILASCYLLGGEFDKARPILEWGYNFAPAYAPAPPGSCGTGMPVYKNSFGRALIVMHLDGYRDGAKAEALSNDKANGLAQYGEPGDTFNHALGLDLQKKYDQAKVLHEKVLAQQQIYPRGPGIDRKPDLENYRKLAFKPDRSAEETAQLMECFAWLHEVPETRIDTAADRAIVYRKKHIGANSPEILAALKRQAERCVEIKKLSKYADCRCIPARYMRLLDAQEQMKVDKAEIESTKSAIAKAG